MKIINFKNLLKLVGLIISFSLIGYFLLVLVFMIPTDNILDHARYSFNRGTFDMQGVMYGKSSGFPNPTEKLIVQVAAHKVDNPFKDSLRINNYDDDSLYKVMIEKVDENSYGLTSLNYGRYWYGVEVIMKPLLFFMIYEQIRNLTLMCMIILFTYLMMKIRKYGNNLALGLLISFIFLNPIIISITLGEFFCAAISFITMLIIIKMKEDKELDFYKYEVLFTLTGVFINYFDLLRFPLITLGLPLSFFMKLNKKEDTKENVIMIFKLMFCWFIGYSLMWFMKWALYSIILNENKFIEIIDQALFRASSYAEDAMINYLYMFLRIAYASLQFSWPLLIVISIIYYIKNKMFYINKNNLIIFTIISLLPFVFTIALPNFCYIHVHLAYRNFVIPLFSAYAFLVKNRLNNE